MQKLEDMTMQELESARGYNLYRIKECGQLCDNYRKEIERAREQIKILEQREREYRGKLIAVYKQIAVRQGV